jgi:hypothetical protein
MKKKNDSKRSTSDYIPQLDDYDLPRHIEVDYSKAKPNRFAGRVKPRKRPAPIPRPPGTWGEGPRGLGTGSAGFTHGGKRGGAGRKPASEPIERHTITLYKSHAKRLRALDKNLSQAIRKLIESAPLPVPSHPLTRRRISRDQTGNDAGQH